MNRRERRKGRLWTVVDVKRHADGGTTLTMQNSKGTTKTQNYPPGAMVQRVICPECRGPVLNRCCTQCGHELPAGDTVELDDEELK